MDPDPVNGLARLVWVSSEPMSDSRTFATPDPDRYNAGPSSCSKPALVLEGSVLCFSILTRRLLRREALRKPRNAPEIVLANEALA